MRKVSLFIIVLFITLSIYSQEEQDLKVNPLIEIQDESGELKRLDFEETFQIQEEIVSVARACINGPDKEINFQDLFKNEDTIVFHFRDVVENQMYLFVGDQNLQNSRCVALTFREVYENYKLLAKAE